MAIYFQYSEFTPSYVTSKLNKLLCREKQNYLFHCMCCSVTSPVYWSASRDIWHAVFKTQHIFFFLSLTCSIHSSYVWKVIAEPDHSHGHIPTLYDSPGRGMSPSLRPLSDNKQQSQETDIYTPAEFEPATPATERPQTYTLDRAATGNGVGRHTPKLSGIGLCFFLIQYVFYLPCGVTQSTQSTTKLVQV